jgi:hypothetical protein
MRIEMERNFNAERREFIAYLKIVQHRPDIQKILQKEKLSELPPRLKDYLIHLELTDKENNLTPDGEKAKKTGSVSEKEYGQYEMWEITNDTWLETRPIALRRIYPGKNSKESESNWHNAAESYDSSNKIYDFNKSTNTELSSIDIRAIRSRPPSKNNISLTFTADSDSPSFKGNIEGNLSWSGKMNSPSSINIKYPLSEKMEEILPLLLDNYDSKKKALRVSTPEKKEEIISMKRNETLSSRDINNYGKFEKITISELPIIPNNKNTAAEWIRELMLIHWNGKYVSIGQSITDQENWLQKEEFNSFNLSADSGSSLLNQIGKENYDVYWNVAAMQDLIPKGSKIKIPFSLKPKTDVLHLMRENLLEGKVNQIIIADRFIKDTGIEFLKKLLPPKINLILYTTKQKGFPESWTVKSLSEMGNTKDAHERIWIIKSEKGSHYWSATNSLDHFKCTESGAMTDAFMSFSPIQELPMYLKKMIKEDNL